MDGEIFGPPPAAIMQVGDAPSGFAPPTLAAVMAAARAARALGRDPAQVAREVAWGLHPALPAALITDCVDYVLARV